MKIKLILNKFKQDRDLMSSGRRNMRSAGGNIVMGVILCLLGFIFMFPIIFTFNQAFKPLNEMQLFPPKLFVQNPTLDNFRDFGRILSNTLVPFSRYLFNSLFIIVCGSAGHIIISCMCAYPLAKYRFPGSTFFEKLIRYSLMINTTVTMIPNFITISKLGLIDTYGAIILPAFSSTLGLYLIFNFMCTVPDEMMDAAKIDGANHMQILLKIMMPLSKPALITAFIQMFQNLWVTTGSSFIYDEKLKTVPYMINQIASGTSVGVARQGVLAAASLLTLLLPLTIYIICQSNVASTMATSGMKE